MRRVHQSDRFTGEVLCSLICSENARIASRELPHTSEELGEPTAEDGHAHDGIGGVDVSGGDIKEGEDESR